MQKPMLLVVSGTFVAGTMLWFSTPPASAVKSFKEGFKQKYVKEDPKDPKEKEFAEIVAKAKCNVCHLGKKKKNRNAYGVELAKLLDKKADKGNMEKIQKALDQVAAMKSNPNDEKSPTFGELIQQGKLPAGGPDREKGE